MTTETDILQAIRLALGDDASVRLSRNNTGKLQDRTGRWVQFGIFSPGGADLIGWKTVEVTQAMVGSYVAVVLAIEVKTATGKPTTEQLHFLATVKAAGGRAGIARSILEAQEIADGI